MRLYTCLQSTLLRAFFVRRARITGTQMIRLKCKLSLVTYTGGPSIVPTTMNDLFIYSYIYFCASRVSTVYQLRNILLWSIHFQFMAAALGYPSQFIKNHVHDTIFIIHAKHGIVALIVGPLHVIRITHFHIEVAWLVATIQLRYRRRRRRRRRRTVVVIIFSHTNRN